MINNTRLGRRTSLRATVAPLSLLLVAVPSYAQQQPAAPAKDAASVDQADASVTNDESNEILVVGSRIRRSPFNSPEPITIITRGIHPGWV